MQEHLLRLASSDLVRPKMSNELRRITRWFWDTKRRIRKGDLSERKTKGLFCPSHNQTRDVAAKWNVPQTSRLQGQMFCYIVLWKEVEKKSPSKAGKNTADICEKQKCHKAFSSWRKDKENSANINDLSSQPSWKLINQPWLWLSGTCSGN